MRFGMVLLVLCSIVCAPLESRGRTEYPPPAGSSRIFVVVLPAIHPLFRETSLGVEDEAKALGVTVRIEGPETFNAKKQIEIVEGAIRERCDGIAIDPSDPRELTPAINNAVHAGLKVVAFADDASESGRMSFIGTDDFAAGRHIGQTLARIINFKGDIIVSTGVPSQNSQRMRLRGAREALADYPAIRVVETRSGEGDEDKTLQSIEQMVEARRTFAALLGLDSISGPAAVLVWKAKGLAQPVIAFDDLPETLQGIRDGKITLALVQKQYLWGRLAIRRLNDLCSGTAVSRVEHTGIIDVTRENVDNYRDTQQYQNE